MDSRDGGCTLCGSHGGAPFTVQRGYRWFRCQHCCCIYLSPQPTAAELERGYGAYLPRDPGGVVRWENLMRDVFRHAGFLLQREFGRNGRLLDVGCAYGFFLEAMARRGWEVQGIDLSREAVAMAQQRGLRAQVANVDDAEFAAESFDVVTMFYVLEHLRDPASALRKAFSWLRPGGGLLLRIPHSGPIVQVLDLLGIPNAVFDPPFHLTDMCPAVLQDALRRTGYVGVRTFPGAATRPGGVLSLAATKALSGLGRFLHAVGGEALLLPGISKTTLAYKPVS